MRVIGYVRVSTDLQAEHGLGLEVQREAIKAWAKTSKNRIVGWAEDQGVSGSNGLDTREGLLDAVAEIREKSADGMVVYRLDRLARDLVLQEQLLAEIWRMDGTIFSCSPSEDAYLAPDGDGSDPSRKLIRQVLGAVAEYERSMIRLRLRSGKARKAAKGGWIGGQVPFGWDAVEGNLVPNQSEQGTLARIHELHDQGSSTRHICRTLEAERCQTKGATTKWHPIVVSRILKSSIEKDPSRT
jgi:DNA invertase Pin-like site-specific DNA recombinase